MEEGINWFGGMFTYDGMQRWQLWFDNPNKAAVFLAELSIIGLALMFLKARKTLLAGTILFLAPAVALIHTFSRGGLIAWVVSSAMLLWRNRSQFRRRAILAILCIITILVYATCTGLSRRMTYGLSGEDESVGNRLVLWSAVPRMMHDAPMGWGLGQSGEAYMNWYQPLSRHERYRTLVNSHLTWVVETGYAGAALWMAGWIAALYFGSRLRGKNGCGVGIAECVCLCIGGMFSSVMEEPCLWLFPVGALLADAVLRRDGALRHLRIGIGAGVVFSAIATATMFVLTALCCGDSRIAKCGNSVRFCGTGSEVWALADEQILGGRHYPRLIREASEESELATIIVVDNVEDIPERVEYLAICGSAKNDGRRGEKRTMWLSPSADAQVEAGDIAVVGEFSQMRTDVDGVELIEVLGVGEFIPAWPEILSVIVRGEISQCN